MRESIVVNEELRDLEQVIAEGQKIFKENQGDFVLQLSLAEDEARYTDLLLELKAAIEYEQKHSLQYVFSNVKKYESISLEKITLSLSVFHEILKKINKKIFKGDNDNISLNLVNTFAGSFGFMLSTKNSDMEMLSKSYSTFEYIFRMFNNLNNDETTINAIKELQENKATIKEFLKFYKIQSENNIDLSIRWGDTYSQQYEVSIKKERSNYIYNTLKRYNEIPDKELDIVGVIKGISLIKNKIEIYSQEYEVITISATTEQIEYVEKYFNKEVKLRVKLSQKENEMIDDLHKSWKLINILE